VKSPHYAIKWLSVFLAICCPCGIVNAATLISNVLSVSTTVGTTTDSTPPTQQALSGGSINATASQASVSQPGSSGNLRFDVLNVPTISLTNNSGTNSGVAASIHYVFTFNVAPMEIVTAYFDLSGSLTENGVNGNFLWSLAGPDGGIASISGTAGSNASTNEALAGSNPRQSAILNKAGDYSLSLEISMPSQSVKGSKSLNLAINSGRLDLQSVSPAQQFTIPEPNSVLIGELLAVFGLFRRRR
jgi:hypothetical protein